MIRRQQVRERGRVGQGGEDGADDQGVFRIEVGVQTESTWVPIAGDDAVDSIDELVPASIAVALQKGIEILLLSGVLGCHACRDG